MSRDTTVSITIGKGQMGLAPNQNEVARAAYAELRELARNRWGSKAVQDGALEFGYIVEEDAEGQPAGLRFLATRRSPPA